MTIDAQCPGCGKQYRRVKPELAGKKAECSCGQTFILGTGNAQLQSTGVERSDDSINLSSANVFENSYSDLDQILAGHGSAAPVAQDTASAAKPRKTDPPTTPTRRRGARPARGRRRNAAPTDHASQTRDPTAGYGNTARSVGFLASLFSGTIAAWSGWLIASSRFNVLPQTPLHTLSQTIHDLCRGTFGTLPISQSLQTTFVGLGWLVFALAAALVFLGAGQLLSAFAKVTRQRGLIPGIDGLTAITATALLFITLSSLFFHSSHMSQLTRELNAKVVGQANANTLLARNVQELHLQNGQQSHAFVTSILITAAAPLCVCVLSITRVYVTLGED